MTELTVKLLFGIMLVKDIKRELFELEELQQWAN